jgi:LPXTG-motif cell wall-anchored protein
MSRKVHRGSSVLSGEVMRLFRLLPAAVVAIALLASPVKAVVRHRPETHAHRGHTRHRHAVAHKQRDARAVNRAGSAILALSPQTTAHAASDTTVTIADFQFTPASITIHVGDTVTWTNHGPSAHTATANNGSFNTGVLQKGQSASHTFNTAGTFSYICSIHPFMHGTVVVLANTTSTTPATTPTTTTPTTTTPTTTTPASTTPTTTTPASTTSSGTTAAQSSANTLPMTGFAVTGTVLAGVLLTGLGLVLRKKIRA